MVTIVFIAAAAEVVQQSADFTVVNTGDSS